MGVLDEMTKGITEQGIMARKDKAAGPKLTPVGTEGSPVKPSLVGIPDVPEVFLTNEAVADISRDLRVQAATLITVADALDARTATLTGEQPDVKAEAKAAAKVAEKEADAKQADKPKREKKTTQPSTPEEFKDHLATITAEAKAAAFTAADAPSVEPEAPVTPAAGWVCPEHGDQSLKQLTSRADRLYMACQVAGCKRFEK